MNQAAVATHHAIATEAGRQMLLAGGNATDAAIAAMTTLCVVVPGSVGLGGYGGSMVLYDAAAQRCVSMEFNTRGPLEYRDELYADDPKTKSTLGYLSTSTPAIVAGLAVALQRFGTKTWKDATLFATDLAENGFAVDSHNRTVLELWHKDADDLSRRSHFTDGNIPDVGQQWVQKDLAKLFRQLAADGPESFYKGDIAEQIVRQVRAHGGILSREDFATFEPTFAEPLSAEYRGHTVVTPPPTSGGITMLQMLQILEHFDLKSMQPWSAPYLHLVADATQQCWGDRKLLGDPDCVKIPYADLLATSLASSRAANIRKQLKQPAKPAKPESPHTCNVVTSDTAGNFVSLTATQGAQFGSGVVIEGLGLVLGHGMSRFCYGNPQSPNGPAPGKRPQHNMCPSLILQNKKPVAALGLPGGTRIPTVTAQLIVSLLDFKATPEQAVHANRVHAEGPGPLLVSETIDPQTARDLEAQGHTLEFGQHALGTPMMLGGPAGIIHLNARNQLTAASTAAPDAACVIDPATRTASS